MKVVINRKFGGFGLSSAGLEYYYRLKGITELFYYTRVWDSETENLKLYKRVPNNMKEQFEESGAKIFSIFSKDFGSDGIIEISSEDIEKYYLSSYDIDRADEDLIKTVEDLGEKANGRYSRLVIIKIPDDVQWQIEEEAGVEWVAEVHRTWGKD